MPPKPTHVQFRRAVQNLLVRKISYERAKHKIVNQYIERRKSGLLRSGKFQHEKLESAAKFANERADFWLTVVLREIEDEIDTVVDDFSNAIKNDISIAVEEIREQDIRASRKFDATSAFEESPDFLKSFDIFKAMDGSDSDAP
jgi:hypothetical protein